MCWPVLTDRLPTTNYRPSPETRFTAYGQAYRGSERVVLGTCPREAGIFLPLLPIQITSDDVVACHTCSWHFRISLSCQMRRKGIRDPELAARSTFDTASLAEPSDQCDDEIHCNIMQVLLRTSSSLPARQAC